MGLEDANFNKKVKKNAEKIKKVIEIIQQNRLADIKEQEKEVIFNQDLRRVSIAPHRQKSTSMQVESKKDEDEKEKEKPPRILIKAPSNSDKLAMMFNANAFPKLKAIKERSPIPSPSSPKTRSKSKVIKVG